MKETIVLQTEVVSALGRADIAVGMPNGAPGSAVAELAVDAVLADSFPASDPPSWTPGIAETRPSRQIAIEVPPVKSAGQPVWLQRLGSMAGLIGIVLALPVFVVLLPLAFAWRAVLAETRWRAT